MPAQNILKVVFYSQDHTGNSELMRRTIHPSLVGGLVSRHRPALVAAHWVTFQQMNVGNQMWDALLDNFTSWYGEGTMNLSWIALCWPSQSGYGYFNYELWFIICTDNTDIHNQKHTRCPMAFCLISGVGRSPLCCVRPCRHSALRSKWPSTSGTGTSSGACQCCLCRRDGEKIWYATFETLRFFSGLHWCLC